ncbi:MAG: DUF2807 domain-containing protein [Planctomycetota bacterium]
MRARHAAVLLAASLPALGCFGGPTVVRGTGEIVQERRVLRATDSIALAGELDASIEVAARDGGSPADVDTIVWIEGASDLIELVETVVEKSKLVIRTRDGVQLEPNPNVEIHATRLVGLGVSGAGNVRVVGLGTGVESDQPVVIDAAGAVDVQASGEVDRLVLRQAGACDLHFEGVVARDVEHTSAGAGNAWVHATETLRTEVIGAGDVHVYGNATVKERVVGVGGVQRETGPQ